MSSATLKRDYEETAASVSNEDWRPRSSSSKAAALKWWDGLAAALHDVGGKAKVSELAEHDFIKAIASAKGRSVGIKLTLSARCNTKR